MRLAAWSARSAFLAGIVAASALGAAADFHPSAAAAPGTPGSDPSAAAAPGTPASARLVGVSAETRAGAQAVLIEATEPVAYSVSRPDSRTVVVELRNVSVAGAANRVRATAGSLVAHVAFEDGTALDGSAVGRIRLGLVQPATHRVRSTRNTIRLELEQANEADETGSDLPATTGGADPGSATAPDAVWASPAADEPKVTTATSLLSIRATVEGSRTIVTLRGNGFLAPGQVIEAESLPPRVLVDFPGVSPAVPAAPEAKGGPVERVRVAINSRAPLVTRVVIDLSRRTAYHVERTGTGGRDLSIVFEEGQPTGPVLITPVEGEQKPGQPRSVEDQMRSGDVIPASGLAQASGRQGVDPMSALKTVPPAGPPAGPRPAEGPAPSRAEGQTPPAPQPPSPPASQPAPTPPPPRQPPSQRPTADATPGERQYSGHNVNLDFQNADLRAVLRTFAEISGLNMVIDPAVQGTVDIVLTEVPWDQALDIILRGNKLGYTVDGTIVRIAPLSVLADEETQRRKLQDERALAGELRVRTFTLSYAKAQDMQPLLTRSALSQRGQIQMDPRTNTLIITDLPERLTTAENLIAILDRPEPQVEVEARVVQTTREFARELGVQWGLNGRVSPEIGNTTGLAFPNRGSLNGRTGSVQGPTSDPRAGPLDNASTGVNLPVGGATSAIGLALGSINGAFNLDLALSALERTGRGRVLSTPRLTTQNNVEAEVAQGVQIPIQTVANNTVTVSFKDAVLLLKVTPQITAANTVIMQITIENASPDFSRQVNNIPPIDTQRALTRVQVNDGATTVIGGIFVSREQSTNERTPLLHRIPLLGWLFRRDITRDESRELLIFITPRILRG
jgi:type IV pilus assembly protein PilQ